LKFEFIFTFSAKTDLKETLHEWPQAYRPVCPGQDALEVRSAVLKPYEEESRNCCV
jgi:hypothetical protein